MHDTYDRSAPGREQNDYTGNEVVLLPSTPNLFGSGILKETVYFQTFR